MFYIGVDGQQDWSREIIWSSKSCMSETCQLLNRSSSKAESSTDHTVESTARERRAKQRLRGEALLCASYTQLHKEKWGVESSKLWVWVISGSPGSAWLHSINCPGVCNFSLFFFLICELLICFFCSFLSRSGGEPKTLPDSVWWGPERKRRMELPRQHFLLSSFHLNRLRWNWWRGW